MATGAVSSSRWVHIVIGLSRLSIRTYAAGLYNEKFYFNNKVVTEISIPEKRLLPRTAFPLGRLYIGDWPAAMENILLCK